MRTPFLLISDPKVQALAVQENNEPLVDVRELGIKIRPQQLVPYEGRSLVRKTVAEKLLFAQSYLPFGVEFYFSEGLRPLKVQQHIYQDYYQHLAKKHPDWDQVQLQQETSKFIAPPEGVPPHSTGGAFDLTLINAEGEELDMGSGLDEMPDNNENRNFTFAANISAIGKTNRALLCYVLSAAGFINYPTEWWHWSYGDKYWAYYARAEYALYGSIKDIINF